ncbi:MAG: amidohydrolase family protein [Planctomycetes bacterium]|nr:amidohydrolase family protein [Planctomycetota bacterium]
MMLAVALALFAAAAPETPKTEPLVLRDGTIHTITGGIIRHGSVVADGGKIRRIGAGIALPEDAEVIELRGRPLLPGLVAAAASGLMRTGSGKAADSADPYAQTLELALASGITTFHQMGGDGVIFRATPGDPEGLVISESAVVPLAYSTREPAARFDVREKLRRAAAFVREMEGFREAKLRGDEKAKPPRSDPSLRSFVDLIERTRPAWIAASDAGSILAVLELADEFPIRIVIVDALEAWTVAEEIARRKDVSVIYTPRDRRYPDPRRNFPNGWRIEAGSILSRAGVPFAIVPPMPAISMMGLAGRDLTGIFAEAAFAVRGGLGEDRALEAITIEPARILGIADRVGSIEEGKDADLIVLSGDPFHYQTYVEIAVARGEVVFERAKSRILRKLPGGEAAPDPEAPPPTEAPDRPRGGTR